MGVHADDIAAVLEAIRETALRVTVTRETPATYDPATQRGSGGTTDTWTPFGVLLPVGDSTLFAPGTLIARTIQELWLEAVNMPVEPRPGDRVAAGGHLWTVLRAMTLAPDGTPIVHRCFVER
ncbi:MAG TPA: hypothetical protein VGE72_14050 [Azospirillum sp.]